MIAEGVGVGVGVVVVAVEETGSRLVSQWRLRRAGSGNGSGSRDSTRDKGSLPVLQMGVEAMSLRLRFVKLRRAARALTASGSSAERAFLGWSQPISEGPYSGECVVLASSADAGAPKRLSRESGSTAGLTSVLCVVGCVDVWMMPHCQEDPWALDDRWVFPT